MKVKIEIQVYESQHDWSAASETSAEVIATPEAIAAMNWEAVCSGLVTTALADFDAREIEAEDESE